jgi:hypothetical protein
MLFQKLLGAAVSPIAFVGSFSPTGPGSSASWTISYAGNLTGGLSTSPQGGDLVVVIVGASNSAARTFTAVTSGYTKVAELYANNTGSTADAIFAVFIKIMGSTPDTNFEVSFSANIFPEAIVYCLRNVDGTTPQDATATTATTVTNGTVPNPAAITPVTLGAAVVACAVASGTGTVTALTSSDLSNFATGGSGFARLGIGVIYDWSSGAVDPAAFGGGGANIRATAAVTLALRPA